MPAPQQPLLQILCPEFSLNGSDCSDNRLLPLIIANFKTPTLRDLGQSNPYLHNGVQDTIEGVLNFYVDVSQLARAQQLRDSSPEISVVFIDQTDVAPLSAFLNALNEDYD
jgi:cytochrome c peroxidase